MCKTQGVEIFNYSKLVQYDPHKVVFYPYFWVVLLIHDVCMCTIYV